ncbi:DeoR/GlpR transcriptional regulator, partial [Burkholderia multivorans]
TEAKAAIARAAVARITPGSVIGRSGGTTTFMLADALSQRDDLLHDLTIVTNAVEIAHKLPVHPRIKVIVCGGVINASSFELVGSFVDAVLRGIWIDLAFIGVHAFSATAGGTTANEDEAYVNRLMAQRAERAIVGADSSKGGRRSVASVGGTEVFE